MAGEEAPEERRGPSDLIMDSELLKIKDHLSEADFWKQVKKGLPDERTHLSRIENTAGSGISDISGCRKGVSSWIELKVFKGKRLYFQNSQRSWITTRSGAGGLVFVLARDAETIFLYDAWSLMAACPHHPYKEKSFYIEAEDLARHELIAPSKKPFHWEIIREEIFRNAR